MWGLITVLVTSLSIARSEYKYETKWLTVPLDHFSYQRNETFKMRYLENEEYWDRNHGPIFFYTGNEAQVEVFLEYTGFMWDIAQEYRAKLVFAEHRYYGKSMPFGNVSLNKDHLGFLSSSQALADFAYLVDFLQDNAVIPKYPVIAFGGSYGGMLAAYFRMKYPHVVAGAIAGSAPIHMYPGMMPCDIFNRIVTSSFSQASPTCSDNIRRSWKVIRNFITTNNSAEWFKKNWRLCDGPESSTDVQALVNFLTEMYTNLAMVNYPYPSSLLMPLPAFPVRVVCQFLNETLNGMKLMEGIGKALEIYTNYNHNNKCVDYKNGDKMFDFDASAWDYQVCTEIILPICSTGKTDMFELQKWNFTEYAQECHKKFNVYPRENDARINYGGSLLQAASNIVFSNGLLDPWIAGGVLNSISESVKAVLIPHSPHFLDLMASNPADPESVRRARSTYKQNIDKWIDEFTRNKLRAKN